MANVRKPAVAGLFYPNDPPALEAEVGRYLSNVTPSVAQVPRAIIVPHAGYIYSAPIAASAYARLETARGRVRRVVLLGPAHRVGFRGLAMPTVEYFETPLGRVPIDVEALKQIADLPQVVARDDAHAEEHSLEVQLPFLQILLDDFALVPLVVGEASAEEVGEVIERLWPVSRVATANGVVLESRVATANGVVPETLIVVSSDLSHYHSYAIAQQLDRETSRAIEQLRYEDLDYESACGRNPVSGLLYVARKRGLRVRTVDLRNSGDTAGPHNQVVGYGAYLVE